LSWPILYDDLLNEIKSDGVKEYNSRTKQFIRIHKKAFSFSIDLEGGILPIPSNRSYYPTTPAAEVMWFIDGSKSIEWLERHTKIWTAFSVDNEIQNAYGHRIKTQFGRDQLQLALSELRTNPSNRQIVVQLWDASVDGLGESTTANVPCPTQFILNVIDGRLNMTVMIRSSDVFVGLPYDVMSFAFLLAICASELDFICGQLNFTLAHAHIYEEHIKLIKQTDSQQPLRISMPKPKLKGIQTAVQRDLFVWLIEYQMNQQKGNTYNPRPTVYI